MLIVPHLGKKVYLSEHDCCGCITAWIQSVGVADINISNGTLLVNAHPDGVLVYSERESATHLEVATPRGLLVVRVRDVFLVSSETDPLQPYMLSQQEKVFGCPVPIGNK